MPARLRSFLVTAALLTLSVSAGAAPQDEKPAAGEPAAAPAAAPVDTPAVPEITKEVLAEGKGDVCGKGRAASVHYVGTFKSGKKFDSSRDRDDPFVFEVGAGSVIEGWDEVVAKMRVGDRWKVVIPWQKAYGEHQNRDIPAKSDLVFDIELLAILEPAIEVLTKGKGEALADGDRVSAHVTLTTSDGKVLTDTRKTAPITLPFGGRVGITGVDMVMKRMRVGDHWKITVPPALAFGKRGSPPRIGPNAEIVADIEFIKKLELEVEVLKKGDGPMPTRGQIVKVHYTGTFLDGNKFDSSRDRGEPFKFPLGAGRVIAGWDMMLARMRVGERVKVTIPWQLAYGDKASRGIPAKSDLVFDIELLGIE